MYNEDTQEEAVVAMKKVGFSMGRMLHPITKNVASNVVLSTKRDGPFWYGDLDLKKDMTNLQQVSGELGAQIEIRNDTGIDMVIST